VRELDGLRRGKIIRFFFKHREALHPLIEVNPEDPFPYVRALEAFPQEDWRQLIEIRKIFVSGLQKGFFPQKANSVQRAPYKKPATFILLHFSDARLVWLEKFSNDHIRDDEGDKMFRTVLPALLKLPIGEHFDFVLAKLEDFVLRIRSWPAKVKVLKAFSTLPREEFVSGLGTLNEEVCLEYFNRRWVSLGSDEVFYFTPFEALKTIEENSEWTREKQRQEWQTLLDSEGVKRVKYLADFLSSHLEEEDPLLQKVRATQRRLRQIEDEEELIPRSISGKAIEHDLAYTLRE